MIDEGRLTDGQGRTVDFRNSIIIMTSNLGSNHVQQLAGEDNYQAMTAAVIDVVKHHFRPEFINRIDEMVVFHPLSRLQFSEIARIQIAHLTQRLVDRDLDFQVTEKAIECLVRPGVRSRLWCTTTQAHNTVKIREPTRTVDLVRSVQQR